MFIHHDWNLFSKSGKSTKFQSCIKMYSEIKMPNSTMNGALFSTFDLMNAWEVSIFSEFKLLYTKLSSHYKTMVQTFKVNLETEWLMLLSD